MLRRARLVLIVVSLAFSLAGAVHPAHADGRSLPALAETPDDALAAALREGRLSEARYALARALSLFELEAVRARHGAVQRPDRRAATLVLRDLYVRLDELSPGDRALAERILSRPTDGNNPGEHRYSAHALETLQSICPAEYCISWVTASSDAVPPADANQNGRPDYVDSVIEVMTEVWSEEIVALGFRPPKADDDSPTALDPDGRIDIYLTDVGAEGGLFGFCTSDDPKGPPGYPGLDASAYCVLDNDYTPTQYPITSGVPALQVTAAHEFFHAVQFAYSALQDRWLMEATAVWMEDQVFDDVNDNYGYIQYGPIAFPDAPLDSTPLDRSHRLGLYPYGAFVFFEFLSENLAPGIVREIFEKADGAPGQPGYFSTPGLELALEARGVRFRDVFAAFGAANVDPPTAYEEGADWRFFDRRGRSEPAAVPLPPPIVLTSKRPERSGALALDHMSNGYVILQPGRKVAPRARLTVSVDGPPAATGPGATLLTVTAAGKLRTRRMPLDAAGRGSRAIPFGRVRLVVLVLTNASTRFEGCLASFAAVQYTCAGFPLDDGLRFRYTASLRP
jgi:hypothetical protein